MPSWIWRATHNRPAESRKPSPRAQPVIRESSQKSPNQTVPS
jgi:hypothetical protein